MKKVLSTVIVFAIIFASCKSGGGDPKAVLANFFDALARKDFTAVKKYTTKDSEGMLGMVQMGMQNIPDTAETMKFNKENIELGNAVINGDIATVPVKEKRTGETTDFTLKKESGDWKVAFDKSTLMEMAQKKMKEHGFGGMHNSMQDVDSVSREEIRHAQKMLDSANKMLNKAKENEK